MKSWKLNKNWTKLNKLTNLNQAYCIFVVIQNYSQKSNFGNTPIKLEFTPLKLNVVFET